MYSMNIRASVAFAPTGTPKLSVDPYWAGFDSSSTVMNCEFSARNAGLSAHSAHVGGFAGSSPASSSRMCVEKSSIAAVPFRYAARALGTSNWPARLESARRLNPAAASVHSSESIVTSPSSTSWQPAARKIDSTASVDDGVPGWVPSAMPETPVSASAAALADTGVSGIALGTQPGTPSSTEAVEPIFLAAGCQLVEDGEVTIDSDECTDAAAGFKRLADSSLAGQFDVPSARAAYLNGTAAMLLFSTHILDELAGLDPAN